MATPTRFMPDTSCIVPALLAFHPDHSACRAALEERLGRGEQMVVAAHTLAEAYRVLTGMPAPRRIAPEVAWRSIEAAFVANREVVQLEGVRMAAVLTDASRDGIAGGSIYDFLIAATAVDASVSVLVTRNIRDFGRFRLPIQVASP